MKTTCKPNTVQASHPVIIGDVSHDYILKGIPIFIYIQFLLYHFVFIWVVFWWRFEQHANWFNPYFAWPPSFFSYNILVHCFRTSAFCCKLKQRIRHSPAFYISWSSLQSYWSICFLFSLFRPLYSYWSICFSNGLLHHSLIAVVMSCNSVRSAAIFLCAFMVMTNDCCIKMVKDKISILQTWSFFPFIMHIEAETTLTKS